MSDFLLTRWVVEKFQAGGPMMWALLVCSVLALMVIIYKAISFALARTNTDRLLADVGRLVQAEGRRVAVEMLNGTRGPVAAVAVAGLEAESLSREGILEAAQEAGTRQLGVLESWLPLLSTVASIAPLLGFLGTVTGMIKAFEEIKKAELLVPGVVAGGIAEALITTATGLIIAIPCLAAYNWCVTQVRNFSHDMERTGAHVAQVVAEAVPHEA